MNDKLATYAAFGFAAFALWWITRTPSGSASTQPAQQQRDAGLQAWYDSLSQQQRELLMNLDAGT